MMCLLLLQVAAREALLSDVLAAFAGGSKGSTAEWEVTYGCAASFVMWHMFLTLLALLRRQLWSCRYMLHIPAGD
jgi:hypothetical protein